MEETFDQEPTSQRGLTVDDSSRHFVAATSKLIFSFSQFLHASEWVVMEGLWVQGSPWLVESAIRELNKPPFIIIFRKVIV